MRFLIEQGAPEANIETQAFGNQQNLTFDQVKRLLDRDTDISAELRGKNREEAGKYCSGLQPPRGFHTEVHRTESAREYSCNADDFARLADRNGPMKPPLLETAAQREGMGTSGSWEV